MLDVQPVTNSVWPRGWFCFWIVVGNEAIKECVCLCVCDFTDLALTFRYNSGLCWVISMLHRAIVVSVERDNVWLVLLWPRPRRCLTLSTHALRRSWMAVCPDFTLQMIVRSSGWKTLKGEPAYKRRSDLKYLAVGVKTSFFVEIFCEIQRWVEWVSRERNDCAFLSVFSPPQCQLVSLLQNYDDSSHFISFENMMKLLAYCRNTWHYVCC